MHKDFPEVESLPVRVACGGHRLVGGAAPWLILVVVVLGLLGGLAMWGPGRGGSDSADAQAENAAATHNKDITGELEELGDLLIQGAENKRDLRPLLDRLDALIAEQPGSAEAHTLHAQILLEAGRPEEALGAFQEALKIQPRQAQVHEMAGNLAMRLEQFEGARHHYEQALSIEPGSGRYAVCLANLQFKINEDDEALVTLLSALRRDSELHSAYSLIADIYAKKNKIRLALDQSQRAIDTVPEGKPRTRSVYVLKRAALLRRNNQPAESLAVLSELSPDAGLRALVLKDMATSWAMLGKPEMAAKLYEQVLRGDPSSDLAAAAAARWRIKVGDIDAAREHVGALRRINPRHEDLIELERELGDGGGVVTD